MRKRALLPAVLLLAVAGCSGGAGPGGPGAGDPAPATLTATTGSTAASETPLISPPPTAAPSLPTDVSTTLNAIKDLQKHTCSADADGSWTFKGTLVNASEKARTYTVAVAVTVGAAVQGHTLITKTVPAGKSAEVSAGNFAKTTGSAGQCEPVVSAKDAS